MSASASAPAPEPRYGWVIVGLSMVYWGFGLGLLISISVFLKPLGAEFGWPRGATSFAYLAATLLNGVAGVVAGTLADRLTVRPFVVVGSLALGLAHLLLGTISHVWQLYAVYGFLIGFLGLGLFKIPLLTSIQFWFTRNRGLATGLTLSGQTIGAATVPLLARWLIATYGWREAYLVLGAIALLLVPLSVLVRQPPGLAEARAASRRALAGAGRGARRAAYRPMTALCAAIVCCCVCMSIPLVHLVAHATDLGIDGARAASVLSVMMMGGWLSRVSLGKVADWIGGFRTLLLGSGLQTSAIFLFTQVDTVAGLYAIAFWFGLGYGGVIPSYAYLTREVMPAHMVGQATGVVLFFGSIGMGQGGFWGGWLFDRTGDYTWSFALGALAGVANLLIVGTLYLRTRSAARPVPALEGV